MGQIPDKAVIEIVIIIYLKLFRKVIGDFL